MVARAGALADLVESPNPDEDQVIGLATDLREPSSDPSSDR